jgi:HK97 family phage portal protein
VGWLHSTAVETKALPNIIPIDPFGTGRPNLDGMLFPDSTYTTFALNGFSRNQLVYACIMAKAGSLPQAVLRVYPDTLGDHRAEPLPDHRLRRLIAQPNPTTNECEFLQLSIVHLDHAGNCYWLINRGRDGVPAELWPVRPDLIRILPSRGSERLWRYGYVVDPTTGVREGPAEVIPVDRRDLIHIKYPNPLDAYFGQAPLRPATRAISVDNARTDYVDTLLRNDAVPRAVVTTQKEIDDKVIDRLTDRWMRKHGGDNRGKPVFLQQGMEVKTLGLNLEELEFGEMSGVTEAQICQALRVPPIIAAAKVGLDRSTFANMAEAEAYFWKNTLMDLQHLFMGGIRSQLLPEFSGVGRQRIDIRWDNSEVLALQEAESEKWERATNALARGGITRNMFLRTVGLDPVPGGDVFLTPAGVTPTPADGDDADEPELDLPAEPAALRAAAFYAQDFLDRVAAKAHTDADQRTNGHHPTDAHGTVTIGGPP